MSAELRSFAKHGPRAGPRRRPCRFTLKNLSVMGLLRTFITALRHYLRGRNRVHIVGDGELHIAPDARLRRSKIYISPGSCVQIENRCSINGARIALLGDNNSLIFQEAARLLGGATVTMEGNSTVIIGRNAGVRRVDFVAKDADITVGERCMFSNNIVVRNHDSHKVLVDGKIANPARDIVLGKHVWIGQNVSILKSAEIGDDSILGFGSVVTNSCPPGPVMAGHPARIIKTGVSWDY